MARHASEEIGSFDGDEWWQSYLPRIVDRVDETDFFVPWHRFVVQSGLRLPL
jgi:hypothetical protein